MRQYPSIQTKPLVQSKFTVHPLLHPDNIGVGVGVFCVSSHVQLALSVQLVLRQALSLHTSPDEQSAFTVQVSLQPTRYGVGVSVSVGVLVGVSVTDGVPDGVVVGVAKLKDNVHAGSAAFGVT